MTGRRAQHTPDTVRQLVRERAIPTRKALGQASTGAYNAARMRFPEVLDELFGPVKRRKRDPNSPRNRFPVPADGKWSTTQIIEFLDVGDFPSRRALILYDQKIYDEIYAIAPHLLDEAFGEIERSADGEQGRPWTRAELNEAIRATNTPNRNQLSLQYNNLYRAAQSRFPDLLVEIFGAAPASPQAAHLTEDAIRTYVAYNGLKTRAELERTNRGAYRSALKHYPGLLDELFGPGRKARTPYTPAQIRDFLTQRRLRTRADFKHTHRAMYNDAMACHREILDEFF